MKRLDEWMSTREIAESRNLKLATVISWCNKGWLPAEKVGRSWRVKRSDWEAFLKNGLQPAKKSEGLASYLTKPSCSGLPALLAR